MKFKKVLIILIMLLVFILLNATNSYASSFNNWNFDVQLNEDGSMDVVETWNIHITETNTLYKTFKLDSSKFSNITNVKVEQSKDGRIVPLYETNQWAYHLTKGYYFGGINTDGDFEISWGVGLDNSSDTRTYRISYTVNDVVKKYGDCAEIYWQFIGEDFEIGAKEVTGTIKLPSSVENKEDIKVWGHTKYLNGEIYATDNDTVEFMVENYKAKQFVEVRILTPTDIFSKVSKISTLNKADEIIEEETKWAEEANLRREKRDKNLKTVTTIGSVILLGLGALFTPKIKKYKKELQKNPKIVPEMKMDYYRELPDETATPVEADFVLNRSQNISKTLSATILNLTLKGILIAKQDGKKIKFEIQNIENEPITEDEEVVLNLLRKSAKVDTETHRKVVEVKDIENYIKKHPTEFESLNKNFDKISKERSIEKQKYDKNIEEKSATYVVNAVGYIFMIIFIFVGTIGLIIYSAEFASNMIKYILAGGIISLIIFMINIILCGKLASRFNGFTQKGIDEQEKWKAFKKYMEDFSMLDEREVPELVLWEKYLVYATAFGIAEKVIKQLKIKFPELNDPNNINSNLVLFSAMSGPHGLNTNFVSSINTSTSHMYSSTYSSGSGSGGGFSGGGGGRWTVEVGGGGR